MLIKNKGVLGVENIEGGPKPKVMSESFTPGEIRQFIVALNKLIDERKKGNLNSGIKELALSIKNTEDTAKNILTEIQSKCREAPLNGQGSRNGFKVKNIYITPVQVEKFMNFNL